MKGKATPIVRFHQIVFELEKGPSTRSGNWPPNWASVEGPSSATSILCATDFASPSSARAKAHGSPGR